MNPHAFPPSSELDYIVYSGLSNQHFVLLAFIYIVSYFLMLSFINRFRVIFPMFLGVIAIYFLIREILSEGFVFWLRVLSDFLLACAFAILVHGIQIGRKLLSNKKS